MNTGAFGEGFPYTNFHDLNMDWIIKIAKDFLDQYTHIQEIIEQGKTDIEELTNSGLEQLQEKADNLEELLQEWYNTHSEDIANQLRSALDDLNTWYTQHIGYLNQYLTDAINTFNTSADQKAAEARQSIPADYTALSDEVSEMKNTVDFHSTMLENLSEQITNNGYVFSGESGHTPGQIASTSADTKRSGFIYVKAGQKFRYSLRGISAFFIIAMYTAMEQSAYIPNSGVKGNGADNHVDGIYTVSQDGYIMITNMNSYTDAYMINTEELNTTILEIQNELTISHLITQNGADLIDQPGYVVSDETPAPEGKIYYSSNDTKRTDFIQVKSGDTFIYDLRGITAFLVIAFYTDKDESTYVSGIKGNGVSNHISGEYTAPSDGYIIITNMISYQASFYNKMGIIRLSNDIDTIKSILAIKPDTTRPILSFGDSLARGAGNSLVSYSNMIASMLNSTLYNYAVSGTPFANYGLSPDYGCVYNQVETAITEHASDDISLILIEGGINDLKRNVLDIGTLSDNYNGTYQANMIIGSLEHMLYRLRKTFPSAIIVFVMYHHMPVSTQTITPTQMLERENQEHVAFKSVCQKWSVPMADIYAEGQLNSYIEEMADEYFRENPSEHFGRDIAHPNETGYKKFYVPCILKAIRNSIL